MPRHECYVPHNLEPFRGGNEVWKQTGLYRDHLFDLGKLRAEYLLWVCGYSGVGESLLVHGESFSFSMSGIGEEMESADRP